MKLRLILALALILVSPLAGHSQASPFSQSVFPAQIFTTTGQTGSTIQLNGLVVSSTVGSSFTLGTVTLTGTSLTTVTFSVMGSADNGATFYQLPISTVANPSATPSSTVTATANGLYQVSLAGMTHIKFVTSGTFTATNVTITLTATPNAGISRLGQGSGGGGVTPGTVHLIPQYNTAGTAVVQSNVGTDSTGNNLNIPGAATALSVNQEINGALFASPELAVAAACSASSHAVYFPAGIYTVTTGMQICSSLHIRCVAPPSLTQQNTGTVFRLQAGAAVWALSNPNADAQVTPGAGSTSSISVDDCGFDISSDSAALGAIQQKGVSNSHFRGNAFFSNANSNPVVVMDGGNFSYNFGDYDNIWIGNNFYDNDEAAGGDMAILMTNTQTSGGSNSNSVIGGSISRYGTEIQIDSGNNNTILSVDLEDFATYGVHLTSNTGPGGVASQNYVQYDRFEAASGSRTGVQIDSGAVGNQLYSPFFSGAFTYFTDANSPALNGCVGCFYGTQPLATTIFAGLSSGTPFHNMGVGAQPACLDGWQFNCLFVKGEVSATKNYTLGSPSGGYHTFVSNATTAREIIWPDATGGVLLSGTNIPLTPTGTATPSQSYSSQLLQFQGSYYAGVVTSAAYSGTGITAVGASGTNCSLTGFNGGGTGATATVTLTGTNAIVSGAPIIITAGGSGYTSAPTTATASSGSATCSGTASISTIAAKVDTYQCFSNPETGTNPVVDLICEAGGSSGQHRALMEGFNWVYYNNNAATSSQNQPAPYAEWLGAFWNGTANASDLWQMTHTFGTGTSPTSYLVWSHSGSSGAAYVQFPAISINGSNSPVTSTSSTGAQVVTCAPGGTSTQFCGADGTWHTAVSAGSGLPAGCNQAPCQVATVTATLNSSITASTGYTTMYTTTQAGKYQLCAYLHVTVAGVGSTPTIQADGSYISDTVGVTPSLGPPVSASTLNSHNDDNTSPQCDYFYADSGSPIKWNLVVGGTISSSPTIRYGFDLFYMGS